MILIDVFLHNNDVWAWLYNGEHYFYPCHFSPTTYVYGKNATTVLPLIAHLHYHAEWQQKKTIEGIKKVLAISTSVSLWKKLLQILQKTGFELYNSDIPLEEYYLFHHDVFPGAHVTAILDAHDRITMLTRLDNPFDAHRVPALQQVKITTITTQSLRRNGTHIEAIDYNGTEHSLAEFITAFTRDDPDIIVAENIHLIAILTAIRTQCPNFSFSRFGNDQFQQEGGTFTSYGQVHYKDPCTYLKGRLHFSPIGVLYGKWNISYPFELARICRVPLQKMNHRSIGYGVSNIQQYYAFKNNLLIPWKMTCVELWRSGIDLFNADRGSLIYEPRIGFHTTVAEIDFISLFPSIMVKYNISPETLFCRCCKNNTVPGLNINICRKKDGIMRQLLTPIIAQRQHYKAKGKSQQADALKGLLVCSFGYMGFRKSKLARIECHQAILAYAREILLKTAMLAEDHGFSVVHGITDSLWVKGNGSVQKLMKKIEQKIGLPIKLEGKYKWIVFLPSSQNKDVPVPTRYYGVFSDGEVKVRGIELRRHDTPLIIKEMQTDILTILTDATTEQEFKQKMNEAKLILRSTINRIVTGQVAPEALAITIRLTKTEYTANIAQKQIIEELRQKGFTPKAGQYIRYLIQDKKHYSTNAQGYSKERYVALAKRAWRNMFLPFEKTETLNLGNDSRAVVLPRIHYI